MTTNSSVRPYLIQRLNQSTGRTNPFSFGGGLPNGGLTKESMDILLPLFSFDYMGAAQFEYGAVPSAFERTSEREARGDMVAGSIKLKCSFGYFAKGIKQDFTFYYYCPGKIEQEVKAIIKATTQNDKGLALHEPTLVQFACAKIATGTPTRLIGWFDIQHDYCFFLDQEIRDKLIAVMKGQTNV